MADVDGDGKPDILVVNACVEVNHCGSGVVGVLLGNGDGTFQPARSYGSGGVQPFAVAVADVNGDGKPDLLLANACANSNDCTGELSVLFGNGDGTFQTAQRYATGGYVASSIWVADVNGDGKPDVLVANTYVSPTDYSSGVISVFLANGDGTFRSPRSIVRAVLTLSE